MATKNPVLEINEIVAEALKKHFDIIRRYMIVANESDPAKKARLEDKFNRKAEDFLAFLLESFPMPDPANRIEHAACLVEIRRVVFINENNDLKRELLRKELHNLPPTILLQVLPVAFMRDLLCYNKVRLNPGRMPSWKKFSKIYQSLILGA